MKPSLAICWQNIEKRINTLRGFEQDLKNPEVDNAIIALHKVFDPYKNWFLRRKIVVTFHGSLQFIDPRNLDIDVTFLSAQATFTSIKRILYVVEAEFEKSGVWPRKPAEQDICNVSLGEMKAELKHVLKIQELSEDELDDFFAPLGLSFFLTSLPLWPDQTNLLHKLRGQAIQIINSDPHLCNLVLEELDHIVGIRIERRKWIRPIV